MDKKVINYIPHFKYINEELEKEISQEKRKNLICTLCLILGAAMMMG